MQISKEIQQGWAFAAHAAGAADSAQAGAAYLASVEDAIRQLEKSINDHSYRMNNNFQGYAFEEFSAGTFNIDAVAAGSHERAEVLHSNDLGSVDVRLKNSGEEYSMKSYATPEKSANQQARLNTETREALYKGQARAVPTDQIDQAREAANRKFYKEQFKRPDVAESYRETSNKLTDTIRNDEGIESRRIARKELDTIAKEAKKQEFKAENHNITPETVIKTKYLLDQAGKAGLTAAAITMALQLAPEIINTIDYLIQTGEIRLDQLVAVGGKAVSAGGESFLRGSVAYTLTVAIQEGKLGALQNLSPTMIGLLVVITIQTVKDSILVALGKMKPRELGASLIRTTIIAGGTTLGMAAVAKIGAAIGQTICPVVGFIIGTLVGCSVSALYNLGKKQLISFCVDSGFTCFGLVEQDYALPEETLHELGIETIEIPRTEVPRAQVESVSYTMDPERIEFERVQYTVLRRGIIGINRIGYIPRTSC